MGYKIGSGVYIGKSIILCNSVKIDDNVAIKHRNIFKCQSLFIGNSTKINSGNTIAGMSSFSIGSKSRVMNDHFFDVSRNVSIGNSTWVAGRGSQFWTHGSIHTKKRSKDLGIEIKDDVYVGSNSCFAPGVSIESINLIGLGSVVNNSVYTSRNIIAGNPAMIVKEDIDWRENW